MINVINDINVAQMKDQSQRTSLSSIDRMHSNLEVIMDYVVENHRQYDLVFFNRLFLKLDRIEYDVKRVRNDQYFFKHKV